VSSQINDGKTFYSKVLLFGEYSVIKHSMALSTPYKLFEGHLAFRRGDGQARDPELKALAEYLKRLKGKGGLDFDFDLASFEFDVAQGLFFDSTIPQGYGVGSSGALVAALFDRYGTSVDDNKRGILELKRILARIESHFHGSSSGLDPLISYLNESLLIGPDNSLGRATLPDYKKGRGAIFDEYWALKKN
jgi:mevalonate kinase